MRKEHPINIETINQGVETAYLRDILPKLPHMTNRTAKNYTPSAWKASHENL